MGTSNIYSCGYGSGRKFLYTQTPSYNAVADNTGLFSFIKSLLPPKSAKSREILGKFEIIAVQGHPRSSILVPIESAYATYY